MVPHARSKKPAAAPAKRPREDALLEAERLHQRRRIELLNKHLLGKEAEVRRLEEQCFAASTDLEEIMSEVSHVSAALQAPATRSESGYGGLKPTRSSVYVRVVVFRFALRGSFRSYSVSFGRVPSVSGRVPSVSVVFRQFPVVFRQFRSCSISLRS